MPREECGNGWREGRGEAVGQKVLAIEKITCQTLRVRSAIYIYINIYIYVYDRYTPSRTMHEYA